MRSARLAARCVSEALGCSTRGNGSRRATSLRPAAAHCKPPTAEGMHTPMGRRRETQMRTPQGCGLKDNANPRVYCAPTLFVLETASLYSGRGNKRPTAVDGIVWMVDVGCASLIVPLADPCGVPEAISSTSAKTNFCNLMEGNAKTCKDTVPFSSRGRHAGGMERYSAGFVPLSSILPNTFQVLLARRAGEDFS